MVHKESSPNKLFKAVIQRHWIEKGILHFEYEEGEEIGDIDISVPKHFEPLQPFERMEMIAFLYSK